MAVDMYMKIEGIEGESQDDAHAKEIDVVEWSWGVSQGGTTHMGGGSGAGKVDVQDISFTKFVDAASANLLQHCMSGKHIPEATLSLRKAGDGQKDYSTIVMKDLIVSSVTTGATPDDVRLTEKVTLNFGKVEYVYKPQKSDGSFDADKKAGWDIAANKALV